MEKIPISKPTLGYEEKLAVQNVIERGNICQGERVLEFEKAFARYIGSKYAIATNSGTSALHISYLASGMSPKQIVATTPLTFIATNNMLIREGLYINYCNLKTNFNMREYELNNFPKLDYIIPVHLFGAPCNMIYIKNYADERDTGIVEDCCQSLGATINGKKVGTFGDIGVFSFYASKMITTGEGGMCVTNDPNMAEHMRDLRNHSLNNGGVGYNYRMTDIAAAIGLVQLKKINSFIKRRREIAKIYNQEFENVIPDLPTDKGHVYNNYTFCIQKRDKFVRFMQKKEISCRVYYPEPLCEGTNASDYCKEIVSIPIYPTLSNQEVYKIVNNIKKFIK